MKTYTATFYRFNPQLSNGVYEVKYKIDATNKRSAMKKAHDIEKRCLYGSMRLISLE